MRMIIGFLLYWFSMHGYYLLLNFKFKVRKEFTFPIATSLLIIVLFLASILNMLFLFSVIILYGGFISYLYLNKHKLLTKKNLREFFDYKYFILMAFVIYFTIVSFSLHLTHYDNFSHWALSIKQLFTYDTLGSFKYSVDRFTSYPPASSLFAYYFGLIFTKSETAMLIGHAYLNLSFMSCIMALFNNKKKITSSILFVLLVIVFCVINIKLNELLVDTTLGLMGITSFVYTFVNRDNYKKCYYGLTIFSIALLLMKNSGVLFVIVNAYLLYLVLKRNNKVKEGKKYILYMILIVLAFFMIWEKHLAMVYPSDIGYTSKHSISIDNVGRNVLMKGPDKILHILKLYFYKFIDLKDNLINHYLIIFNIFLLLMAYFYKKNRQNILKSLLFLDVLALLYYLALGAMYIISMPYEEATYLAGFGRYMYTMIVALMGIIIITVYYHLKDNNVYNKYFYGILILFLVLIISNKDYEMLVGIDHYDDSSIKTVNAIRDEINLDEYKDVNKVFYIKIDETNNCSYYHHAFKYVYFNEYVMSSCENFDYTEYDEGTVVVVPDEEYTPITKDNKKHLKQINNHLYEIVK